MAHDDIVLSTGPVRGPEWMHKHIFIAGEGDNRVLMRNDAAEIRGMVEAMAETGRMSGGYMMCIGNHIPFNVPAEAVKRYLEISRELAWR